MSFQSLFEKINPAAIEAYQERLAQESRSPATLKRRASSIRQLCKWATQEGYLPKWSSPLPLPRRNWGRPIKVAFSLSLLTIGVILVFLLSKPPSFPTQITTQIIASYSPWIVSFRGKLLSPGGELILDEAKVIFKVYSQEKNGDSLWQSKTWELAPNEQGEFQAPIGDTTRGDYELPSRLFFQNERLWLEAVVNSQPLSPRTPLSTASHVADALNLGGFPPSQKPAGEMVPVLTNQGNLILAANSPKIQSTQGTFAIEGQAVTINTPAGSDGNITLAPDGSGVLNLILSSPIGNLINATDANLGSSGSKETNNLYYGKVVNNNTNYHLLKLESGSTPTPKFTVDASGNVSAAGNVGIGTANPKQKLTIDGTIGILEGDTSPTYHTIIKGGDQSADITYTLPASVTTAPSVLRNNGSGALSWGGISSGLIEGSSLDFSEFKDNMTLDGTTTVAFGSRDYIFNLTGTGDFRIQDNGADFFFANDSGNIGIGTTSPGSKLQIAGDITPEATGTRNLGSSTLYWNALYANNVYAPDSGTSGYWQRNLQALSPTNITDDLLLGATATSSALIKLTGTSGNNSWINTGNVGIGTTSLTGKFHVSGAVTGKALTIFNETGDQAILTASASGTTRMTLNNAGQFVLVTQGSTGGLVIGSDTNLYRGGADVLTTDDTLNAVVAIQTGGTIEALRNFSLPQRFYISSANDANVPVLYIDANGQITMNAQGTQAIRLNYDKGTGGVIIGNGASGEVARFTSGGNVGIGTTGPQGSFEIKKSGDVYSYLTSTAGNAGWYISRPNTDGYASYNLLTGSTTDWAIQTRISSSGGGSDAKNLVFRYDPTSLNAMVISSGGNVGIGTTSPGDKLEVAGGGISIPNAQYYSAKNTAGSATALIGRNSLNNTELYAGGNFIFLDFNGNSLLYVEDVGTSGNLGIGTTGPGQALDVVGKIQLSDLTAPGSDPMCWDGSGTSTIGDCTSLRKYKENIQELSLGLDTILKLDPKTFYWKQTDPNNPKNPYQDLGFIAEEVEAVNPLLATHRDGELTGVRYEKLTAVLINAIKEQQAQIAKLFGQTEQKIISPVVETEEIKANQGGFGKLLVQNEQGETVASIDTAGNATFAGQINAESLQINTDATVAGTLYAKKIESEEISALKGSFGELLAKMDSLLAGGNNQENETNTNNSQNEIKEHKDEIGIVHDFNLLTENNATDQKKNDITNPNTTTGQLDLSSPATSGATTAEANETWAISSEASDSTLNWESDNDTLTDSQSSTSSGELSNLLVEIGQQEITNIYKYLKITSDVKILGKTSLADTTVAGSLNIGGTLSLTNNSINSLTGPLYLNSLGLGGIDILAGKIVIDQKGNAFFAGDVTIKGTLAAFGDLVASGSGTFQKIIIANAKPTSEESKPTSEVSTGEITTNATAGEAILPAGVTEITILTPFVTEKTLVYITPTSNTQNKVTYVSAKKAGEYFKVAIDSPVDFEIKFNWWIIN